MFSRHAKWILLIGLLIICTPGILGVGQLVWYGIQDTWSNIKFMRRVNSGKASYDRTLENIFASLRTSAKAGNCDEGMWKKAIWADSANAESPGVVQPVGIEVKPTLCAALAGEKWTPDQLDEYGENGMVGVWRKAYPSTGFSGVIVMYAKRPAPDQPYEVTHWGAYPRLDGALQLQKGSE